MGAVVLGVAAVFVFGSGRLFADTQRYVMYFDGSLKGLSVGSPVTVAGIEVGSVVDISVVLDMEDVSYRAPVTVEIDRNTFVRVRGGRDVSEEPAGDPYTGARQLVEKGFCAQLQTRSFVTGMLEVALDFRPGTEVRLVGGWSEYPEIPTIPSTAEQISRTLESLPIQDLVTHLDDVARGIDDFVNSERAENAMAALEETLQNLRQISEDVGRNTAETSEEVRGAVEEIRAMVSTLNSHVEQLAVAAEGVLEGTLEEIIPKVSALVEEAGGRIGPLSSRLEESLASAQQALDAATSALTSAGETPTLQQEARLALQEVAAAARALRDLADYLERHPESLLHGKGGR